MSSNNLTLPLIIELLFSEKLSWNIYAREILGNVYLLPGQFGKFFYLCLAQCWLRHCSCTYITRSMCTSFRKKAKGGTEARRCRIARKSLESLAARAFSESIIASHSTSHSIPAQNIAPHLCYMLHIALRYEIEFILLLSVLIF